jgi:hypothetical protein
MAQLTPMSNHLDRWRLNDLDENLKENITSLIKDIREWVGGAPFTKVGKEGGLEICVSNNMHNKCEPLIDALALDVEVR